MSNIFKVEDGKINSERRTYKLDTDLLKGFKTAVNNNQLYRALEYMVHIVEVIEEKFEIEDSLAPSRKVSKTANSPANPPKEEKVGEDK